MPETLRAVRRAVLINVMPKRWQTLGSLDGFIAGKDGSVDWLDTSDQFVGGDTMDFAGRGRPIDGPIVKCTSRDQFLNRAQSQPEQAARLGKVLYASRAELPYVSPDTPQKPP